MVIRQLVTLVICEEDGVMQSGHCTCMAGLGEVCSHIEALLFNLESASRVNKSCTQIGCVWKEPRIVETIPYAEIADLLFEKPKSQINGRKRVAHLYSNTIPLADLQLCKGTGEVLEEVISTEGPLNTDNMLDVSKFSSGSSSSLLLPSNIELRIIQYISITNCI